MSITSLREYLQAIEASGQLVRVDAELSTRWEVAAALRLAARRGKVPLFSRVEGYTIPVVGNLMAGRQLLALAMGLQDQAAVTGEFLRRTAKGIPPVRVANAPAYEVAETNVDILASLPVLTHHERDAGPYMTAAVTIARDPETGAPGMGIHRIQVKGPNRLGIFLSSPPLGEYWRRAEAAGKPLPVAICVGLDPLTWFASVIRVATGANKLDLAGGLRQQAVPVVSGRTVDLEIPAEAEIVLEGHTIPGLLEEEGPFGESNGAYLTYNNPVVEITGIYHRQQPIYHALLPFNPEEGVLMGVAMEGQNLRALQHVQPGVLQLHIDPLDWTRVIVQVDVVQGARPRQVIDHLMENVSNIKTVVVVDPDIDPFIPHEVAFALATRLQPERDVIIRSGLDGLSLDPTATPVSNGKYRTSKIGFDTTIDPDQRDRFAKIQCPPAVERLVAERLHQLFGL